jgi:hypothetical protein
MLMSPLGLRPKQAVVLTRNGHLGRPQLADFCQSGATQSAGQIRCKRLVKSNANEWANAMQTGGQVECNYPGEVKADRILQEKLPRVAGSTVTLGCSTKRLSEKNTTCVG